MGYKYYKKPGEETGEGGLWSNIYFLYSTGCAKETIRLGRDQKDDIKRSPRTPPKKYSIIIERENPS